MANYQPLGDDFYRRWHFIGGTQSDADSLYNPHPHSPGEICVRDLAQSMILRINFHSQLVYNDPSRP